jgi:imidazolonepropionase-like amidohydrolase
MAGMGNAVDPDTAALDLEMPPMLVDLANYNLEQGALTMRAAQKAGVKVALGSDADTAALELLRMIHHGLTPRAAILAATRGASEALGLGEHIGTIQEGKLADLLVVDGDAVAEPELLCDQRCIWLVFQLGTPVAGQALERALE